MTIIGRNGSELPSTYYRWEL